MKHIILTSIIILGFSAVFTGCSSANQAHASGPVYTVSVSGMTCGGCASAVKTLLKKTSGAGGKISASYKDNTASFQLVKNATEEEVISRFNKISDQFKLSKIK